ncbi:hypothetical protein CIRG_10351 [Coccidioides immitis RMSCC 2394]|uniref:Uncharacterized protein n=1 Tax=Coccidioides immitis RMSCC 2394 TaxID=404692 RepID=A0A0J6Y776_COCIT|nr:hypothetical protein CIRG_10351 [Coccidioides immitis RMSCC 2394]
MCTSNWCLGKLEHGEDSRKLKGIHTEGALQADWKYVSIHYKKITKNSISEEMSKKIHQGMQHLANKYGLTDQVRENTPVYIEDMIPFNETRVETQEK